MIQSLKAALKASISEVLETMFFLPVDMCEDFRPEEVPQDIQEDVCGCRVNFTGNVSGAFLSVIPETLLRTLVKNFLGTDSDAISKDQRTGTISEITNMIAGNTLSRWDRHAVYNLHLPRIVTCDAGIWDMASEDIPYQGCYVRSCEGNMVVHMTIGPPSEEPAGQGSLKRDIDPA
ncbi:MAG: chemotaxis protein CheX [Desulfobacterales bacterium]|nr:chemotaxis protein CheX [Desulfobacterales bacterium]MDD4071450.1 chemotaxis protein CheX [Desulfobacterales bacterium]MDD4393218.1 chemotaxis protein CheX [Desulfobacterales bacterium]